MKDICIKISIYIQPETKMSEYIYQQKKIFYQINGYIRICSSPPIPRKANRKRGVYVIGKKKKHYITQY